MGQAPERILRACVAAVAVTAAQSVYWGPGATAPFSALVTALAIVSAWRPPWGLIALAVLAPFGRMIAVVWLHGHPTRGAEAFALAFLAGVAVRWVVRPPQGRLPSRIAGPWVLFGAVAVASAAEIYRISQFYLDFPAVFLRRFAGYVAIRFQDVPGDSRAFLGAEGFEYAAAAAAVVIGVAILLTAGRLCSERPGLARQVISASVLAGTGAAALSVYGLLDAALAAERGLAALPSLLAEGRWAYHVNKVNTAGSYFVLVLPLSAGLALAVRERRAWWAAQTAAIAVALALTKSLAAILGGVAVAVAAVIWTYWRVARRRVSALLVLVVVVGLVASAAWAVRTRAGSAASFNNRLAILEVSLATWAERPVFGVGIGTYPVRSRPHITEAVRLGFGEGRMAAHNYVLEIGSELGAIGLGVFLWALGAALWFAMADAGRPDRDNWRLPAAMSTAAFMISALAGQPMLVDAVAVPAWIVMGILVASPGEPTKPPKPAAWIWLAVAGILATVPLRAAREITFVDPRRAAHGTTMGTDGGGRMVHVLEGRARLFVARTAVAVLLEARANWAPDRDLILLQVDGPGVPRQILALPPGVTRTACLPVDSGTAPHGPFRALDVRAVGQSGAPAPPGVVWARATGLDRPCGG